MAKKFRYEFGCRHAANATNEQALSNKLTFFMVHDDGELTDVTVRPCPRCASRLRKHVEKIALAPRKLRTGPLPLPE